MEWWGIVQSNLESVIVSESEPNLVDDLNKILKEDDSLLSETQTTKSLVIDKAVPSANSETDVETLQDVLNQADTTILPRESVLETNDTIVSSSNSQSRLPSMSKDIINMLIDIDNANYSKNPDESMSSLSPSQLPKDPRLSDTVISSSLPPFLVKPKDQSVDKKEEPKEEPVVDAENTAKLTQTISISSEESITPNTCFSSYTADQLVQLSEKYKNLVLEQGKHEDVEILLNINSVFRDCFGSLPGAIRQTLSEGRHDPHR